MLIGRVAVAVIFGITIGYFFYLNRENWKLSNETSQPSSNTSSTTRLYRPTGNVMGFSDFSSGSSAPGYPGNGRGGPGGGFF